MSALHQVMWSYGSASSFDVVTDGLIFSLDAGTTASYGGSGQTFANSFASPADGAGQTAYDFYRGATSGSEGSDPTFNGTAGTDPCYFSFDGGDYFSLVASAASMTAFLKGMHKSGSKFTYEIWMRWDGSTGTNLSPLFDSGTSDQSGAITSRGVVLLDLGTNTGSTYQTGCNSVLILRDDSGQSSLHKWAKDLIPSGSIQMCAASIDGTGTDDSFFYRQGSYDPILNGGGPSTLDTWPGTLSLPGSTNPDNNAKIGARGDVASTFKLPNGTRLYLMRMYNRNLSKSELDLNWNATRARFGL